MKRCFDLCAAALLLALCVTASAAKAESVKIGISKLFGTSGAPIAVDRGYFKDQGIDAEMVYFDSAQPIAVGVASGDLDFGVSGMTAGFYTLASQGQLRLIAMSSGEAPGFHALVILASAKAYADGLTSPKDLRGHSVAITQAGSGLHYAIGLVAERYHFPVSEITVRLLQSNTNILSALGGNTVDATVLPGATTTMAMQKADAKLIGWVSDLGVEFTTGSALFTSTKNANDHGDMVKRFMVGYRRGMRDFHDAFTSPDGKRIDGPNQAAVLDTMSRFTGLSPADLLRVVPYADAEGRISTEDVARMIAWFKSQNLIKGDIKAEELIDGRYALPLTAIR